MRTIRKRRLEAKTDYKARLELLKSGKPRLVIRKTSRYIIAQLVLSENAQDKVLKGFTSLSLVKKGWPKDKIGSLKSKAAAYLLGYMLAKSVQSKIKEAILDIGMHRNIQKSRIYALVKGVIDGGLKIPASTNSIPSIEEIKNDKISFDKIKSSI